MQGEMAFENMDAIKFYNEDDEYGELSNFYLAEIMVDGKS